MKATNILLALSLVLASSLASHAQVGIGTSSPNATLDVTSTTNGFLPPRMTYAQQQAISSPATGLMIYCLDCGAGGQAHVYNGTAWVNMIGGEATNQPPTVASTTAASSISSNAATSGGNITNDFGTTITARGVCWSTSPNPTIANSKTTESGTTGSFTSNISGLTPSTLYYVRAYATNAAGTSYAAQESFTTLNLQIGDSYQGGKIAYLDNTGLHGFIIAPDQNWNPNNSNQSPPGWWNNSFVTTNATGTAIGTGSTNTNLIVSAQGAGSYAAKLCADLVLDGYDDWFLPSRDELQIISDNRVALGEFSDCTVSSMLPCSYWSSSEINNTDAYAYSFSSNPPNAFVNGKGGWFRVRAIRNF